MFFVYILKSTEGKYYVGSTSDLKIRLAYHNNKRSPHTSKSEKWELVSFREYPTKTKAIIIERRIKRSKNIKRYLLLEIW